MYGDQCGEFLDWYLGIKGYITDTKSSNLYFSVRLSFKVLSFV